MPTQWELETHGRLEGIETILNRIDTSFTREIADHSTRLGSLERWRSRSYGVVAGITSIMVILGWLITTALHAKP